MAEKSRALALVAEMQRVAIEKEQEALRVAEEEK